MTKHGRTFTYFVSRREVPYDEWALDDAEAQTRAVEIASQLQRTVFVYDGQRFVFKATP